MKRLMLLTLLLTGCTKCEAEYLDACMKSCGPRGVLLARYNNEICVCNPQAPMPEAGR